MTDIQIPGSELFDHPCFVEGWKDAELTLPAQERLGLIGATLREHFDAFLRDVWPAAFTDEEKAELRSDELALGFMMRAYLIRKERQS